MLKIKNKGISGRQNCNSKLKSKISKAIIISLLYTLYFILYTAVPTAVLADDCEADCDSICAVYTDENQNDSCRDQCKSDEEECKKLDKKAQAIENIINLKNKQQNALSMQLDSIAQEKQTTLNALSAVKKKTVDISGNIQDLESSISEKEKEIILKKAILSGLMQTYYDYDQQGVLNIVLADESFSQFFNQADYIEQSQAKVNEILSEIQKDQAELVSSRDQLVQKKEEHEKAKVELAEKTEDLKSAQAQKQNLLIQTQGEEEKYQEMLKKIEAQQRELFNFSQAGNLDEIKASVRNYPAPKSNLASTSWYYSQGDSRWGNSTIGNSKSLMKDYGCAVTCVSMVFRKNGANIDPGKMAKQKIFSSDLINWPGSWSPGISLASSTGHGNVSWSTIDKIIKDGGAVIVYIKKTNSGGGHYVVITGKDSKDYIVHDPYFGPNLYLSTSKALVGKIGTDSKVVIDQMIIYE